MLLHPAPAALHPARPAGRLRRGAVLSLGLIAAATAVAPAALADVEPSTTTPVGPVDEESTDPGTTVLDPTPELVPTETSAPASSSPSSVDAAVETTTAAATPPTTMPVFTVPVFTIPVITMPVLPPSPSFGLAKSLDLQVGAPVDENGQPTAPDDLDLSGAVFAFSSVDEDGVETPTDMSCTTGPSGSCYIGTGASSSTGSAYVPAGHYRITQTAAPFGLSLAADGASPFSYELELCYCFAETPSANVPNPSLFRTELSGTVADRTTGLPVAGAQYTLTAPSYPVDSSEDAAQEGLAAAGPAPQVTVPGTSGPDGTLTFTGWFPPSTGPASQYTLHLVDANGADLSAADVTFTLATAPAQAGTAFPLVFPAAPLAPAPVQTAAPSSTSPALASPAAASPTLAYTGAQTGELTVIGLGLLGAGAALTTVTLRRRRTGLHV